MTSRFGVRLGANWDEFPLKYMEKYAEYDRSQLPYVSELSNYMYTRFEVPESPYILVVVRAAWDEVRRSCGARNRATIRA